MSLVTSFDAPAGHGVLQPSGRWVGSQGMGSLVVGGVGTWAVQDGGYQRGGYQGVQYLA